MGSRGHTSYLGIIAVLMLLCAFFLPLAILVLQSYVWLRQGVWPSLSLADALYVAGVWRPSTTWLGVNQLLEGTPLALGVFAAFGLVGWIFLKASEAFWPS